MINDFHKEHYFLSNFYTSPIYYEGILYPTVEHAFQAAKMVNEDDKLKIQSAESPNIAKRYGRQGLMRSDWEEVKVHVMHKCLMRKFLLDDTLRARLRDTGSQMLVEGNTWHDNCWGDCSCPKCKNVRGTNHLGKLLMEIRENDKKGLYSFAAVIFDKEGEPNICFYSESHHAVEQYLAGRFDGNGAPCVLDDKHILILKNLPDNKD